MFFVPGYMLIRGPRSGHAKRNAIEDLEERVRRDDVHISEIEQNLNHSDVAKIPEDVAPPASSRPQEQPHVTDPLPHRSDDRQAMSIASDVLVDSSQNISEQVEQGYNNVVASHSPDSALPDEEVRELLRWVLDEKIRMRPQTWVERSKIDSDKRLLKQVLKEASLPQIQ